VSKNANTAATDTVTAVGTSTDAGAADFERSLSELEAIVEQLEQGELSLDESLRQFERGVQLTRLCQGALKQAEQKVEVLLRKTGQASGDGDEFVVAPFDSDR
jgi:exodeoxyribonuclease VII small subunit